DSSVFFLAPDLRNDGLYLLQRLQDLLVPSGAQFRVPGGAILGVVHGLAGEERVAPLPEAALLGQAREQPQRHGAQALAREVVAHAGRLGDELDHARRIAGAQLAQMRGAPGLGVVREVAPCLAGGRRVGIHLSERYRRWRSERSPGRPTSASFTQPSPGPSAS